MILALLAFTGGWVGIPAALGGHNEFERFLDTVFASASEPISLGTSHTTEITLALVSLLTAATGFYFAYIFYFRKPGTAAKLAASSPAARRAYALLDHKYWVDEIYGALIVTPLLMVSRILLNGLIDGGLIQGAGTGLAGTGWGLGSIVRRMQSGNIRSYAGWLAAGAAAVIAIALFTHRIQ
jgi:NADH-quinone oxidoreductase subunit L